MNSPIKLPPLPYPQIPGNDYTAADMRAYAEQAVRDALAAQDRDAMRTHNDAIKEAAQVCVDIARQYDPQDNQEHALASELYAAARVIRRHEKVSLAAHLAIIPENNHE